MGANFLRRTTLNKQVDLFLSAILKEKNCNRISYKTMSLNPMIIFQFHLISPMSDTSKYNTSWLPSPGFFFNWLSEHQGLLLFLESYWLLLPAFFAEGSLFFPDLQQVRYSWTQLLNIISWYVSNDLIQTYCFKLHQYEMRWYSNSSLYTSPSNYIFMSLPVNMSLL